MNQFIGYGVSRNMKATDKDGRNVTVALCLIELPDRTTRTLAIPEGLLATVPPDKVDDFIHSEIESVIGYEVTRVQ